MWWRVYRSHFKGWRAGLAAAAVAQIKRPIWQCLFAWFCQCSFVSLAAASPFTPIGAEQAGDSQLGIPPYETSPIPVPPEWQPGQHYLDPFDGDTPAFWVTQDNLDTYRAYLAPGQVTLIERHPSYKLPIYQTRRSARLPESFIKATKQNQGKVSLIPDGRGLKNYVSGFPFPILEDNPPKAALQAMWNHIVRFRGNSIERTVIQATIFEDGTFTPIKYYQRYARASALLEHEGDTHDNLLFYYLDEIKAPSRLAGNTLLVHEPLDLSQKSRSAWVYHQAHKRVRRAPIAAYDTPGPGSHGLRTADSYDMYNGAPDKYNWSYIGKKPLYVPYNAYAIASPSKRYEEIMLRDHLNPELLRWELHRVHVVEAVLKDEHRHIYGKRVFYIDEDSWTILLAEHYDNRGQLWRVAEGHLINYYDMKLPYYSAEVTYDLVLGRYLVFGLSNEERSAYRFEKQFRKTDFTPSALRRRSRS